MKKSEIKAVFARDLSVASEAARALYQRARREIVSARKRNRTEVRVHATSHLGVAEAVALLTHPRNGFRAFMKIDPRRGGENAGRPIIVIEGLGRAVDTASHKARKTAQLSALKRALADAPSVVQDEFRRCQASIMEACAEHNHALPNGFELILYPTDREVLTETQILLLQELLRLGGWTIALYAPLAWRSKTRPRPIGLMLRHFTE